MEFSIITISAFVTLLVSVTRYIGTTCFKKDLSKFLPIFAICYGLILAIAGYFTPDVEMGKNIIEAVFLGIATGAGATGINQVGKQLSKSDNDEVLESALEEAPILSELENVETIVPDSEDVKAEEAPVENE